MPTEYTTWTTTYSDGIGNTSGSTILKRVVVNNSATVRRPRPKDLSLFNGTSLSRSEQFTIDQLGTYGTWLPARKCWRYDTKTIEQYGVGLAVSGGLISGGTGKLDVQVANKLIAKARGESANLALMLAEYRQTAGLFYTACKAFYFATKAVQKRDPRILVYGLYRRNGELKDLWGEKLYRRIGRDYLTFIYGVVPLASDIDKSIKALKERLAAKPVQTVVHAVGQEQWTGRQQSFAGNGQTVIYKDNYSLVTSGKALVRIKNDALLSSLGAYGFTNPASLLWEKIKFSFVIDWWINVGEVLASLDNCLYFDSSRYQLTRRYVEYRNATTGVADGFGRYRSYDRSLPTVLPTVATLRYKPSVSLQHIANGTALLSQLLPSIRRL